MFTSKIIKKGFENGAYTVHVEFSNGEQTFTEVCKPQDRQGFDFWLKSRLDHFNAGELLETELLEGQVVEPPNTEPEPVVLTPQEIAFNTWVADYYRHKHIYENFVATGVIPNTNAKYVALRDKVRAGLQSNPEYLDKV